MSKGQLLILDVGSCKVSALLYPAGQTSTDSQRQDIPVNKEVFKYLILHVQYELAQFITFLHI